MQNCKCMVLNPCRTCFPRSHILFRAESKFYGELRNVADELAKRPTGRFGAFGSNSERFRPHTTGGSGAGASGLRYCAIQI